MSRPNFFHQISQCSFEGTINNVAGDQITQIFNSQDEIVSNGARGESIFDEYHNFRRGDIQILQDLSTKEVDEEEDKMWNWHSTRKKLKYTATAHRVKLFGTPDPHDHSHDCVAVRYGGRDAYAAWERDLLKFSNHHSNVIHLFGLSRQRSNPALVFCDDVVPLMRVWEICSPIVKCYLYIQYHAASENLPEGMGGSTFAYQSLSQGAVFVRRNTGMICFGSQSQGEIGSQETLDRSFRGQSLSKEPEKILPFDLLHDELDTLRYFLGTWKKHSLSQRTITGSPLNLFHFALSHWHDFEYNTSPITLPSISLQTTDSDPFRTVGQFKNLDESYSYMSHPWESDSGEGILYANGWTRMNWGQRFCYRVDIPEPSMRKISSAWLCQAMFYAHTTGNDISRLEQYVFIWQTIVASLEARAFLKLDVGAVALHLDIIPRNIFLFIAPVSIDKCPQSGSTIVSWEGHRGNHYFWSFDPDGLNQIPKRVCDIIGLPRYKAELLPLLYSYHNYQLQAIQCVQEFMGYNTSTQDFAHACGLPLLEIIRPSENLAIFIDSSADDLDVWCDAQNSLGEVSRSDSEHQNIGALPQAFNKNTLSYGFVVNAITLIFSFQQDVPDVASGQNNCTSYDRYDQYGMWNIKHLQVGV
ncbi:hypothetical protein K435DRAFT_871195 [Dendrothele bispora CBS 962.96]|uniref:Uncharacterized protein n=1 Tax=Dendrothele bispora (strain CBS 962.96) TaxID=1314807 RepID=A0A4V4HCM9_DENBC|nr:hypothetical protein K435DRAFT_871195 [Dendrothele bispora CBS 962.96]